MSRTLTSSTPRLCLFAALALIGLGRAADVSLAQDTAAEPTATLAGPAAATPAHASATPHTFDLSSRSPSAQRIERALDDPRGVHIDFVDQPLKEAMEFLNDAHRITILIDEPALLDEGIETDQPLNHVLSGITLRSALDIMLEPLGLTYVIEDEVLKITTRVAAEDRLETRVYDVRPLVKAGLTADELAKAIRETVQPATWPRPDGAALIQRKDPQSTGGASGGGSDPARGHGTPPGAVAGLPFDPAKLLDLAKVLEHSAPAARTRQPAPDRPDTGLVALNAALVVTHNQDVHRRIVALLEQLQRFAALAAHDSQ